MTDASVRERMDEIFEMEVCRAITSGKRVIMLQSLFLEVGDPTNIPANTPVERVTLQLPIDTDAYHTARFQEVWEQEQAKGGYFYDLVGDSIIEWLQQSIRDNLRENVTVSLINSPTFKATSVPRYRRCGF